MRVINFKSDDEYMTPFSAWENIIRFIPKQTPIWECFFGDGRSGQHLRDLGCTNVIHEPIDFFTSDRGEVIISNPPFSLKKQVFKRLFELDKSFILLVPIATLTKQYFTKYFKKCQIIIPQKRIQFVKDGQQTSASWLDVIYLCYNMNLQKDIIYL